MNATTAIIEVDNSQVSNKNDGAVYKGATIAEISGSEYILAANFRTGRIDVFDSNFKPVSIPEESFHDDGIPPGFAPFNVQGVGPNIYVTFAQQDSAKHDPVGGAGLGFVVVFDGQGKNIAHLEHGDWFNAPWGVVLAPADFGESAMPYWLAISVVAQLRHSIHGPAALWETSSMPPAPR